MDKDTTLICTIGDVVKIFHSTEAAKDKYKNKHKDHEILVLNFNDELQFLLQINGRKMGELLKNGRMV